MQVGAGEDRPAVVVARHLGLVHGDAGGSHVVGDRELVVRIVVLRAGEDVGIEVLEIGDLGFVDRGEHSFLDHDRDVVRRGKDDVVIRAAGLELGEHRLVGIEGIVDDLDAVFLLEFLDDRVRRVVGPVEDEQLFRLVARAGAERQREREREAGCPRMEKTLHVVLPYIMGFRGPGPRRGLSPRR